MKHSISYSTGNSRYAVLIGLALVLLAYFVNIIHAQTPYPDAESSGFTSTVNIPGSTSSFNAATHTTTFYVTAYNTPSGSRLPILNIDLSLDSSSHYLACMSWAGALSVTSTIPSLIRPVTYPNGFPLIFLPDEPPLTLSAHQFKAPLFSVGDEITLRLIPRFPACAHSEPFSDADNSDAMIMDNSLQNWNQTKIEITQVVNLDKQVFLPITIK